MTDLLHPTLRSGRKQDRVDQIYNLAIDSVSRDRRHAPGSGIRRLVRIGGVGVPRGGHGLLRRRAVAADLVGMGADGAG